MDFIDIQRNSTQGVLNRSQVGHGKLNADLIKNTNYEKQLLATLVASNVTGHKDLLQSKSINKHSGLSITFTRSDAIGTGERLDEGVTPAGDKFSQSTVSGTLHQYGKTIFTTDVAQDIMNYDIMAEIRKGLSSSAERTIDAIARDEIHTQAGVRMLPTIMDYDSFKGKRMKPSKAANKISEITAEHGFNYWDIHQVAIQMRSQLFTKVKPRVTMDIFGMDSLLKDPWFVNTLAANGDLSTWDADKINTYGGIEFKVIEETKTYAAGQVVNEMPGNAADNTAAVDLLTAIISLPGYGIRLDLMSAESGGRGVRYYESDGKGNTNDDMLGQRRGAGYKFWFGVLLHTPQAWGIYYFAKETGYNGKMVLDLSGLGLRQFGHFSAYITRPNAADINARFKAKVLKEITNEFTTVSASNLAFGKVMVRVPGKAAVELTDDFIKTQPQFSAGDLSLEVSSNDPNLGGRVVVEGVIQFKLENIAPAGQRLFDAVKSVNLGAIEPTEDAIIKAVKAKNPSVRDSEITVKEISEEDGFAIIESPEYTAYAIVNFTKK